MREIVPGHAESKKGVNIFPSDDETNCRDYSEAGVDKKPENKNNQKGNKKKRKYKSQQSDKPPLVRMQKSITAGQQKENTQQDIQQDKNTLSEFPQ
jgi:hypothetical protein